MKNPKEMTNEELYHALKARKIRLGVAKEISTAYSPARIVLTTIFNPVHAMTKAGINTSGSLTHNYTQGKCNEIAKELERRGLDSKKYEDDPETINETNKWVRVWKSVKIVGTIVSIDWSEIPKMVELVSDVDDAIIDFGDVVNNISELVLEITEHSADIKEGLEVVETVTEVSEVVTESVELGNEIKNDKKPTNDFNGDGKLEKKSIVEARIQNIIDEQLQNVINMSHSAKDAISHIGHISLHHNDNKKNHETGG
ncbi:7368_t:CDS:1 [Acaulospora colombiana]|uniref:7368_t:CDS:1 n=1 Tax=Acaulospora colombiana TaxID=27376 RepID=A0ACA9MAV3_9GLOM|nr:7368_t:CDS:1 [Acaulospora colombiana]